MPASPPAHAQAVRGGGAAAGPPPDWERTKERLRELQLAIDSDLEPP
ncbi:MAG TPA: hypothetical protein VJ813_02195 [Vicinamibacterales bacterium]|nr:hypothetical protein [Vicinamibacterales bacterium]